MLLNIPWDCGDQPGFSARTGQSIFRLLCLDISRQTTLVLFLELGGCVLFFQSYKSDGQHFRWVKVDTATTIYVKPKLLELLRYWLCHSAHACQSPKDPLAILLTHCTPSSWHLHTFVVHRVPIASVCAFMLTPACCPPPSWRFHSPVASPSALVSASFLPVPYVTRCSANFVDAYGPMC